MCVVYYSFGAGCLLIAEAGTDIFDGCFSRQSSYRCYSVILCHHLEEADSGQICFCMSITE
jgi:hypothetical protein